MPRSRHAPAPASPSTHDEEAYHAWRTQRPHLFRPLSDESESMASSTSSSSTIAIMVTAIGEQRTVSLPRTLSDPTLSYSLISHSNARASRARTQPIRPVTIVDSHHRRHTSSSCVELRWHPAGAMQSFTDTFYVVDDHDCAPYDAMLRQQESVGRHGTGERVCTYLYAPAPQSLSSRSEGRSGQGQRDREREREQERQKENEAKKRVVDDKIRREIQRRLEKGGQGSNRHG